MLRRCVLITGATSGLGLQAAELLHGSGSWRVVIAGRDPARLSDVARRLGIHDTLCFDMSSLASVRQAAGELAARLDRDLPPLHALVNNAGLQTHGPTRRSADGYELTFAVNHLAPYLLTRLLLPRLQDPGVVIVVSSGTHDPRDDGRIAPPLPIDAFRLSDPDAPPRRNGLRRYTTSKLANMMFALEPARRLERRGPCNSPTIAVRAFDPGPVPTTGLIRQAPAWLRLIVASRLGRAILPVGDIGTSGGAMAELVLAENWQEPFRYVQVKRGVARSRQPSAAALDDAVAEKLWADSSALVGVSKELQADS